MLFLPPCPQNIPYSECLLLSAKCYRRDEIGIEVESLEEQVEKSTALLREVFSVCSPHSK